MDTPSSTSNTTVPGNGAAGSPQKVVDRVAKTAHETVDRVAAAAGPAIEKLSNTYSTAGETLRAKADQFGALEEQWITSARGYVREHPFTAVAIGVLAGLLIGRMGRSD
jgi:ElaB/YqjD/DUF883 family membrane-anchored ribosome-binding protein